jgi:hypothetical protein
MKFPRVFKPVNQISYDPSCLIAGRNAIERGRMILAIWTGERGTENAGVRPRANLAKRRSDSYSRFQAIPAKPAIV